MGEEVKWVVDKILPGIASAVVAAFTASSVRKEPSEASCPVLISCSCPELNLTALRELERRFDGIGCSSEVLVAAVVGAIIASIAWGSVFWGLRRSRSPVEDGGRGRRRGGGILVGPRTGDSGVVQLG